MGYLGRVLVGWARQIVARTDGACRVATEKQQSGRVTLQSMPGKAAPSYEGELRGEGRVQ